MGYKEYYRATLILENYKKKLLSVNRNLNENSGIYCLTRYGGDFKYAYIGQAKHVITRLAQHLKNYDQHIDRSLKKHGLYDKITNPNGWLISVRYYSETELDEREKEFIKIYNDNGFQLYNKTLGGQDKGKEGLKENDGGKGYRDGLKQGYKNCLKEIRELFAKYLTYDMKEPKYKKDGKVFEIKKKKMDEFTEMLEEIGDKIDYDTQDTD